MIHSLRVLTLALLLQGGAARAFVSTRTDSGTPVRWPMRCIVIAPDARGDTAGDDIDTDTIDQTLTSAVANWNGRLSTCTYMTLGVVPATRALEAVSDGRPALVFRADFWGRGEMAYDTAAIGVTTVWFADRPGDPTDGQITDADIELNVVNYTLTTSPTTAVARPGTLAVQDLEATITHELGHVLGLAHTCWDHKTDTPPLDDNGIPAPDCKAGNLPPKVTQATMFPYSDPRAISMRTIGQDDLAGVCTTYPQTDTPPACYGFVESAGCALLRTTPVSQAVAAGVLGLLMVSVALRSRRRRRAIL